LAQCLDRLCDDHAWLLQVGPRITNHVWRVAQAGEHDKRSISQPGCRVERFGENRVARRSSAEEPMIMSEHDLAARPCWRVGGADGECPCARFGPRPMAAGLDRAPARGGEVVCCALAERAGRGVGRAELLAVPVCLLEVVAEDLLVLADAAADAPFEPVC